jgi:hypothetical protein
MSQILAIGAVLCACTLHAAETASLDMALERMYNQDYVTAHGILDQCSAAQPQDPLPYAFQASAYLFSEMDRLGVLESEFFTDDDRIAEKKKKLDPDPATRAKFIRAVQDAESRANALLKLRADDTQALFALSISQGVTTDYMAFIEKKQIASLSAAKRSNNYAQRLLKADPRFYDAYLTAGISEYMVGSLPFFIRWFVHFDNVSGNKEKGVDRLRLVASQGHYFRPFSKILLSIVGLREKRPREAQQLMTELAREFPQNRLFRTELAKINGRLGINAN